MPSAKEVFLNLADQLAEQRRKEFDQKSALLSDFKTSILDPVLDSGRDPKTAGGMARLYSDKRAEVIKERDALLGLPDSLVAVLDTYGVSNLPMEVPVFVSQAEPQKLPPPTSLEKPAAPSGIHGDTPVRPRLVDEGELGEKPPFYPWVIDIVTGQVFSELPVDKWPKRSPTDLPVRQEGLALAMLSIRPDEKGMVYQILDETVPDVYGNLLATATNRGKALLNYKQNANGAIAIFLGKLRDGPEHWPGEFKRFMGQIRLLPVYRELPEADFVSTIALVISGRITFDQLRKKAGIVVEASAPVADEGLGSPQEEVSPAEDLVGGRLKQLHQANPQGPYRISDALRVVLGRTSTEVKMYDLAKEVSSHIGIDTSRGRLAIVDWDIFEKIVRGIEEERIKRLEGQKKSSGHKVNSRLVATSDASPVDVFDGAAVLSPAIDVKSTDLDAEETVVKDTEETEEVEFVVSDEKTYLFAWIVRDQNAQEVRSRRLGEKGFAPKDIERLNGIIKELQAKVTIEDSVLTALEISDDLKTYQAYEQAVLKLVGDNKNMLYLLRLFPTDKGVALDDVFSEMVEAMERRAVLRQSAREWNREKARVLPISEAPTSPPPPAAPEAKQRETKAEVDSRLILNRSETGMFGKLITDNINWGDLLGAWRNGGVVMDDQQEQQKMIGSRVDDIMRDERRAGRDPYRYLRSVMSKIFVFADADTGTRQAIIEAQSTDLGRLFFELFLPFSKEDVRFFAKEFNNRFVSS